HGSGTWRDRTRGRGARALPPRARRHPEGFRHPRTGPAPQRDTRGAAPSMHGRGRAFVSVGVAFGGFLQLFRREVRDRGVDEVVEASVECVGELVHRETDAMIRDAILADVVGPDLLGAYASTHQRALILCVH